MIEEQLLKLESRLQTLIEGSSARLFPAYHLQYELIHRIVVAIRDSTQGELSETTIPPNQFIIHVHPTQAVNLNVNPHLMKTLSEYLDDAGITTGFFFLSPPTIKVLEDQNLESNEIFVTAQHSLNDLVETGEFQVSEDIEPIYIPKNAYLIIDGTELFQLEKRIVNIGRREDNNLVIDDRRVSRRHAQLRVINGRYVIFDLASTGGTWINGRRIQKSALRPGDVISLAGLPLVYSQDTDHEEETQKYTLSPKNSNSNTDHLKPNKNQDH